MGTTRACPSCGFVLESNEPFCPHCGSAVSGPTSAPPGTATPVPPPPAGYPARGPPAYTSAWDYGRTRMIDRTKTGLELLMLGAFLGWIPVISFIGGILALVGAILVILGREAFGAAHSRNVVVAVVLYIIGFLAVVVLVVGLAASMGVALNLPPSQAYPAMTSAFNQFLFGGIVAGIFTGLATVLFLYGLLNAVGKALIWASFLVAILIAIFVFATISNTLPAVMAGVFGTSPPDIEPLVALQNQIQAYGLLKAIPALLSVAAAYVALTRINKGEIPARSPLEAPRSASGPAPPPS